MYFRVNNILKTGDSLSRFLRISKRMSELMDRDTEIKFYIFNLYINKYFNCK